MHTLFLIAGVLLLLPTLPLTLELAVLTLAAVFPARKLQSGTLIKLAVVIPAHNEQQLIAACVRSLHPGPSRIYVVAHNCTDATAEQAAAAGATALILKEDSGHGKGAALHHGFAQAISDGAEAVLVIDADSTASSNLTEQVTAALDGGSHALQCRYISAGSSNGRARLQGLALLGMNVLRPRGRSRLRLSCGIFGNGFALTAATLARVPYAAHSIVEDLEYHLHLLRAGIRVDFLDSATVRGEMPNNSVSARTQRARWEGGRQLMRRSFTPVLLRELARGRLRFAEPLLDLLSLPLATNVLLLLVTLLIPVFDVRFAAACSLFFVLAYVLVAACLGENPLANLRALAMAPLYIAFKIASIPATRRAARKDAAWVRTDRNQ